VEYISTNKVITTGPTGTEYSTDGGNQWLPLSDEKGFHVVRKARTGSWIVIAGNNVVGIVSFTH
jgi:hypothetical protein